MTWLSWLYLSPVLVFIAFSNVYGAYLVAKEW
ncbi:hypothetical protein SEA_SCOOBYDOOBYDOO_33 [Mycobacterium phage ScoobyDoobyDoo]|nr:hypothetical protein SEA_SCOOBYDOOBYDOO_33 [Mycobacterium phage ScoobyDoobyDoo]